MNRKIHPAAAAVILIFLISRAIIPFFGVHTDYSALFKNWQYLDIWTLEHNIWAGVWYDHTQPPVFNLLLSLILHISGTNAPIVFAGLLKAISLANALLLLSLLRRTLTIRWLPLAITLLYLLSPASILFENELFYTSFITLLLLISAKYLTTFPDGIRTGNTIGFLLPLVLLALTRSMYHLILIALLCAVVIAWYKKSKGQRIFITFSIVALLLVSSWYIKNYILFHSFSTSSWMGMNLARNVFHDAPITDSTRIEAIEPFSNISAYDRFRSLPEEQRYKGLNDIDLLHEYKNDSFWNEKHIGYLRVSDAYMTASKQQIRSHPGAYLKNVAQSAIIFFAPATRYPPNESQAAKLKYYDLVYSFNLSQLAHGKQQRRLALTASAIPKLLFYALVFGTIAWFAIRKKDLPCLTAFITILIAYSFFVGSFFEHYENMRFRYEAEPLFLLLAAGVIERAWITRKRKRSAESDGRIELP